MAKCQKFGIILENKVILKIDAFVLSNLSDCYYVRKQVAAKFFSNSIQNFADKRSRLSSLFFISCWNWPGGTARYVDWD